MKLDDGGDEHDDDGDDDDAGCGDLAFALLFTVYLLRCPLTERAALQKPKKK